MFLFGCFIQRTVDGSDESISTYYYLVLKRKQFLTFLSLVTLKINDFRLQLPTAMVVSLFSEFPLTFLYSFLHVTQLLFEREGLIFSPLFNLGTFLIDKLLVAQSDAFIQCLSLQGHLRL